MDRNHVAPDLTEIKEAVKPPSKIKKQDKKQKNKPIKDKNKPKKPNETKW